VGGSLQKYVIACPHVSTIWPIQHGVHLTKKKVSSLEETGFMFDFEPMNIGNLQSLFRGELFTSSNF
jgi:hypothetical protein